MLFRQLGRSDLNVSALCLGGNVFGWTCDEPASFAVLDAYAAGGGNFIDTADVYTGSQSETILGRWMTARKNRDRIILATKLGNRRLNDSSRHDLSRRYILEEVETSLQRLQTDYIDLYQSHIDDQSTPLEETLATYNDLIKQGKVRFIGASNYSAQRLSEALQISQQHGYARYESLQPLYNLIDRETYEQELEPLCLEQQIGVISYFSLAAGFLTGKYREGQALPPTPRATRVQQRYMHERGFRVLKGIEPVAHKHNVALAQVALAWIIARPGITAPIASATSVEQTRELLTAVELKLDEADIAALNTASAWQ